jgi:hypothetical protein
MVDHTGHRVDTHNSSNAVFAVRLGMLPDRSLVEAALSMQQISEVREQIERHTRTRCTV